VVAAVVAAAAVVVAAVLAAVAVALAQTAMMTVLALVTTLLLRLLRLRRLLLSKWMTTVSRPCRPQTDFRPPAEIQTTSSSLAAMVPMVVRAISTMVLLVLSS
jgi:hypothetical protein